MFIARQPIFNKALRIYGYELLFRADSDSSGFSGASSTSATAAVMGGLFEQGLNGVVGSSKAFVNFDYDFIMSDMIELIDSTALVIEILETVQVDDRLLERIQSLKKRGYKVALDDFINDENSSKMTPCADIIKFDIRNTPLDMIRKQVKEALADKKVLLAEKIETTEEFQEAKRMGFQLFQGYFFCKPNIVPYGIGSKKSSHVVYARIMEELKKEDFLYEKISDIIETDVDLSYRLFKILGNKKEERNLNSIKNALVRMGRLEIERWVSILMLQDISKDKPDELFRISLIRSRFGEFIAHNSSFSKYQDEFSLLCLFSVLDVMLDCSMEEALSGLPVSDDVAELLIDGSGRFMPLFMLLRSYESGDWSEVEEYLEIVQIDPGILAEGYLSAIGWAAGIVNAYMK